MRNFTRNRFPIKNLLIDCLLTPIVESTFLNRDMCKFELSQKDESRWQSTDSSKAYRNTSAFKCLHGVFKKLHIWLSRHCWSTVWTSEKRLGFSSSTELKRTKKRMFRLQFNQHEDHSIAGVGKLFSVRATLFCQYPAKGYRLQIILVLYEI